MPNKDGTGPDGKGPKRVNPGIPGPRRDGSGGGRRGGNGRGRPGNPGRGRRPEQK